MKIEFGAGDSNRPGWTSCDVRPLSNVTYVCNCWEIDKHVANNSVDEIYSRHMFEHLSFFEGKQSLKSWMSILKCGGKVNLVMPDLKYHAEEYISFYNKRNTNPKVNPGYMHSIVSIFGWQRETESGKHWDIHKSGYDEISLSELVTKSGFVKYKRQKNLKGPWHLDVVFHKPVFE